MNRSVLLPLSCLLLALLGCRGGALDGHDHAATEDSSWSVTAWSERYELFAETDGLLAGAEAPSHAHFTYLPDFSALNEGSVTGILRAEDGSEERFVASAPLRAGIFQVVFKPARAGAFRLAFLVENGKASEEIAAGRVEVGAAGSPGGLIELPAGAPDESAIEGQPVGFLKEQQWRTPFGTEWASAGSLRRVLKAAGKVLPAAGNEAVLTAPVDGVVRARPWPRLGDEARRGATLFEIAPPIAGQESAAQLAATVLSLEAEHRAAVARLGRLRELVALAATSRREVEEAEALAATLAARLEAARRDQAEAEAQRGGGGESFRVVAPISGRLVEVTASPGQFVAAGATLGRVVATSPLWIELALPPEQAARLAEGGPPAGLTLRRWGGEEPLLVPADALRLVTVAPEVDPATGMVAAVVEVEREAGVLRLGSRVEAELLLAEELAGLVLPISALVDDSGVPVVYVQLSGESFERREVEVVAREGSLVLLRGVAAGERVVVVGANAIRRSVLLGSGAVEGHVH